MRFVQDGSDRSWVAADADGRVGWFTANGSGPVPFDETSEAAASDDDLIRDWVRGLGFRFEFGDGGEDGREQWRSVARAGVYAFDHDQAAGAYRLAAAPRLGSEVKTEDLPPALRGRASDRGIRDVRFAASLLIPDALLTE